MISRCLNPCLEANSPPGHDCVSLSPTPHIPPPPPFSEGLSKCDKATAACLHGGMMTCMLEHGCSQRDGVSDRMDQSLVCLDVERQCFSSCLISYGVKDSDCDSNPSAPTPRFVLRPTHHGKPASVHPPTPKLSPLTHPLPKPTPSHKIPLFHPKPSPFPTPVPKPTPHVPSFDVLTPHHTKPKKIYDNNVCGREAAKQSWTASKV